MVHIAEEKSARKNDQKSWKKGKKNQKRPKNEKN